MNIILICHMRMPFIIVFICFSILSLLLPHMLSLAVIITVIVIGCHFHYYYAGHVIGLLLSCSTIVVTYKREREMVDRHAIAINIIYQQYLPFSSLSLSILVIVIIIIITGRSSSIPFFIYYHYAIASYIHITHYTHIR